MKIDASHFEAKVRLRLEAIEGKSGQKVLECYAGTGRLWEEVERRTGKKIDITRIEKERKKCRLRHLQGDNLKYVAGMDLSSFDIIDLDAYGIPAELVAVIEAKGWSGTLIVTAIRPHHGAVPYAVLNNLGYTKEMIRKSPSLFNRDGIEKFFRFLHNKRVRKVSGYFFSGIRNVKCYFSCKMEA